MWLWFAILFHCWAPENTFGYFAIASQTWRVLCSNLFVLGVKKLYPDTGLTYIVLLVGTFSLIFRVIMCVTVLLFGVRVLYELLKKSIKRPYLIVNAALFVGSAYASFRGAWEGDRWWAEMGLFLFLAHSYLMMIEYFVVMKPYIDRNPSLWTHRKSIFWKPTEPIIMKSD